MSREVQRHALLLTCEGDSCKQDFLSPGIIDSHHQTIYLQSIFTRCLIVNFLRLWFSLIN